MQSLSVFFFIGFYIFSYILVVLCIKFQLCRERAIYIYFLHLNLGGDDDEENEEDEPTPGVMDYIMHFLTLFWKIVFAFIPPTGNKNIL